MEDGEGENCRMEGRCVWCPVLCPVPNAPVKSLESLESEMQYRRVHRHGVLTKGPRGTHKDSASTPPRGEGGRD